MAIGDRIRLARRIAGISLRRLAEKADISHTAIHRYEQNKDVPGSEVLLRLADALDVGGDFLMRPPSVRAITPLPRARAPLGKDLEAALLGRIQEWLERYLETEELLGDDVPVVARFLYPNGFPLKVVREQAAVSDELHQSPNQGVLKEIEAAADALREVWNLGQDPIENLTEVLEAKGIKVGLVHADAPFDIWAFWVEAARRVPVIAVNDDQPGDRQRLGLARELARLLLEFPTGSSEELIEKAVNYFGSAFLLPAPAVRAELGGRRSVISFYELHTLKHRYGVGMSLWLCRAKDLNILTGEDADRLLLPFKETEWQFREPGDRYPPEQPTRMQRMVMHAFSEKMISERRASELLGESFADPPHPPPAPARAAASFRGRGR